MKINLLVFLIFTSILSNATTYYISTTGNDASGTGTLANPWKTLFKATSSVSGVGNIIHVNSGVYTETLQSSLSVGVSLEGDGPSLSIIKSTLTADWTAILIANSPEGTSGNQHISNLKFDGQSLSTNWGIYIGGRSNFSIYNCEFVDFKDRGVIFEGRVGYDTEPLNYATGNTFHDNTVSNCAGYNLPTGTYGRGCLNIGGQEGMLIYNNTITQNSRPEGYNGWPIKGYGDGYLKGCKIYNNTLTKIPLGNTNGISGWDFAIELFHESGLEIYGNTIIGGGIDCNVQKKGSYPYSVWIHDNDIHNSSPNAYRQSAITLEFTTEYAIIENNKVDNQSIGVYFTPRPNDTIRNVNIQKNLFTLVEGESGGNFVDLGGNSVNNYWNNIRVYNNTMLYKPGYSSWFGISLPDATSGYAKNISIINNILSNANYQVISQSSSSTLVMDSLHITNNDIYNNGSSNLPVFGGSGSGLHYIFSSNINVTPTYGPSYSLLAGSPLIDAGVNVGLPFVNTAPDMGYLEFGSITTNVNEIIESGIFVYPNPMSSSIKINFSNNNLKEFEIYNSLGKLVFKEFSNAQNVEMSIKNFDNGVYFLKVNVDNSEFVKKIIKE